MARCVGIQRDLRLSNLETYANYYHLNFRSYTGVHGDCYDRFLIRMNEMSESTSIVNQVVNNVTNLKSNLETGYAESNFLPHLLLKTLCNDDYSKKKLHPEKTQMEEVINEFKK
jgi:NADH:ubiquinone oxidoreductase subunit D